MFKTTKMAFSYNFVLRNMWRPPWSGRPLGACPAYPFLTQALYLLQ